MGDNQAQESVYENKTSAKSLILQEHKTETIIERIGYEDGIQLYLKGCQFPQKSCPTPEAIIATNTVKRTIISFCYSRVIPLSFTKIVQSFNRINYDVMSHYFLKDKFMTKFSREMKSFIYNFLKEFGLDEDQSQKASKIISHIFEYDNAYRYRLQDIFQETTKQKLVTRKEWKRLAYLLYERDDIESRKSGGDRRVGKQFKIVVGFLSLFLYIPKLKRSLRKAIQSANWNAFLMDDGDYYWSYFRLDYNFGGLDYDQRMVEYKKRGFIKPLT